MAGQFIGGIMDGWPCSDAEGALLVVVAFVLPMQCDSITCTAGMLRSQGITVATCRRMQLVGVHEEHYRDDCVALRKMVLELGQPSSIYVRPHSGHPQDGNLIVARKVNGLLQPDGE